MPGREPDEVDCWAYLRPWVQLIGPAPTFYPGLAMANKALTRSTKARREVWQSASFSALSAQLRPVQLEDPCQTRGEGRDPHGVDEPRAAVPRQAMLPSARIHACHNDTFNFSMPASCTGTFSHGGTKHRLRAKYPSAHLVVGGE
ncbi:hypothetical protein PCL_00673 [Purpureocillium lilacinum]|uniref:Uncharacterized protein n=1 Tax=Purpureocillium lilacinum TaxID=33203 RepID=A0A2U3E5G1_PURLI|nr:hypothetical protein PCL_00673 [Purpureocillium lilacinum]